MIKLHFRIHTVSFIYLLALSTVFSQVSDILYPTVLSSTHTPYKGHNLPRLRGAMVNTQHNNFSQTQQDLLFLSQTWKANVIRWQMGWETWHGDGTVDDCNMAAYITWINGELALLDQVLPLCKNLGLYVVVDLHTVPGESTKGSTRRLYTEPTFQQTFITVWHDIAMRYKTNPNRAAIWGYDLANEPYDGVPENGCYNWHDLAQAAAQSIRAVDNDVAIIVEPPLGGCSWGFKDFSPINVSGVVYSLHLYQPGKFTHQGINNNDSGLTYPGNFPNDGAPEIIEPWHYDRMKENLYQWARKFQLSNNVHMFIGEFGVSNKADMAGARRYFDDAIAIFEEWGWDWCYHAFRESTIWDVEGQDPYSPDSRIPLLKGYFSQNEKPVF